MVIPLRTKANYKVKVKSTDADGDSSGTNTIAVQYYAFY